ncbi:MAG TPA: acyltransferase [Salinivirgaceae bacterium]|nr:acyltransferase [Salinivirgaceae bacterium]
MKKKIYFENLDALRALCFLSVFFFHSFYTKIDSIKDTWTYQFLTRTLFVNGNLGVNFFFVLSGFLITYLLIEEKKLNGNISLKNFWIRRILRIWPLFYFCVFFGFVIFPIAKTLFGETPSESADPIYYVTFINNFDMLKKGLPDASILGVLWSVAIEEQFYLLWPVVLYFFPIKRYWVPFTIIITTSLIFRFFNNDLLVHELHTLSCIGDMTIGAFGAWAVSTSDSFLSKIENLSRFKILLIYISFLIVYLFRADLLLSNEFIRVLERSFIAIIILFIILEQNYSHKSFFKLSRFPFLSNLGKITYGLYCLHFLGILTVLTITNLLGWNQHLWQVIILETSLSLLLSILISHLSYKYYESPFLRLKDRFSFFSK